MTENAQLQQEITVLVTGIGGFLGGHVALQLLQRGYRVRGSLRALASASAVASRFGADQARLSFVVADLNIDEGWHAAADGCDYVVHTASPFPGGAPKDETALVRTAKEGTIRVLRAARRANVARVVLTSSIAATNHGDGRAPFTEENWTDPAGKRATPYYRSKTLAERAAWSFAQETGLDLAVINPGLILGPLMSDDCGTSVGLLRHMMNGKFPRLPHFGCAVVDVRDVADAHIRAMIHPDAAGQRFIAAGRFLWLKEIAALIGPSFPDYASALPSAEVPDWLVRIMALFNPDARLILHELGRDLSVDSNKIRNLLGWQSRPEQEAILATAQSLVDRGLVSARKMAR